jgi:translation initiation factor 1
VNGTCPRCGLQKEFCICETLEKEKEKITISTESKRYGKMVTIIRGLSKDLNNKKILKELKHKLACGGTMKNGEIELQGNHKEKVFEILKKIGFNEDQIEVV